jgi:hypothetical protein
MKKRKPPKKRIGKKPSSPPENKEPEKPVHGNTYVPTKADFETVYRCACDGLSINDTAKALHIDWHTYHKNLSLFSEHIKKGHEEHRNNLLLEMPAVVNTLKKIIYGYDYEEKKTSQKGKVIDGVLYNGTIEKTITTKHVPPVPAAIFFMLCNKGRDEWTNPMKLEPDKSGIENRGKILNFIDKMAEEKPDEETKEKCNSTPNSKIPTGEPTAV